MPSATLYTARFDGPETLEYGVASQTIRCRVYRDGALVAPTSGTLTVWNGSGQKVIDAAAITVASSIATYAVTSAMLAAQTYSDGWRFEWTLTLTGDSTPATFRNDGSLVYRRLYPVVTDADILRMHSDMTRRLPSTKTSYQDYLDEAWIVVETELLKRGRRSYLNISPSSLRQWHIYLTMSGIFRDFAVGGEASAEWQMMLHYEELARNEYATLTFPEAALDGTGPGGTHRRTGARPTTWLTARA